MPIEIWIAFVAASTLLLIIPGPTILTVISYSMSRGKSANLALISAVALGDSSALVLSLFGLGVLLAKSAFWFVVIKWVGGLYLIYLGITFMRAGTGPVLLPSTARYGSNWKLFLNTYLVTVLNPKGIVFFVAFLPLFITQGLDVTRQLWILAVTFVVLAIINTAIYSFFAATARQLLTSGSMQRVFNMAGGGLLLIAGLWALTARRVT